MAVNSYPLVRLKITPAPRLKLRTLPGVTGPTGAAGLPPPSASVADAQAGTDTSLIITPYTLSLAAEYGLYTPAPGAASQRSIRRKLRDEVSVFDFMPAAAETSVRAGDGAVDVTTYLQTAIDSGEPLFFPPGAYTVTLANTINLEAGTNTKCALKARTGMRLRGVRGKSIIKLKDSQSTDASPVYFNLIAANTALDGVHIDGITFDLNGSNNKISPNRFRSHTVTITIATPGVVTWTGHGLSAGNTVFFSTTGALPTGISPGIHYTVKTVVDANSFTITSDGGITTVATSNTQSGTHTATGGSYNNYNCAAFFVSGSTVTAGTDARLTNSTIRACEFLNGPGTSCIGLGQSNKNSLGLGTCTLTIASPCVVTKTGHGYAANQDVYFYTTGALPTGLTQNTAYYVKTVIDQNTFIVAATVGGTAINTSNTQSGTHSCTSTGSTLGSGVLIDSCYFYNNGIDSWDHSTIYGWCNDVTVTNCLFDHPTMSNGYEGPTAAFEFHGSRLKFVNNTVKNYRWGFYFAGNFTEAARGQLASGNYFYVCKKAFATSIESAAWPGINNIAFVNNRVILTNDHTGEDDGDGTTNKKCLDFRSSYGNIDGIRVSGNDIICLDTYDNTGVVLYCGNSTGMSDIRFDNNQFNGFSAPLSIGTGTGCTLFDTIIENNQILNIKASTKQTTTVGIDVLGAFSRIGIASNKIVGVTSHPVYGIVLETGSTAQTLWMEGNYSDSNVGTLIADSMTATQRTGVQANGNGILVNAGNSGVLTRSIGGTSNRVSISNGTGVSGNPTIDIDSGYLGQSTITTLGTLTTGVWHATKIGLAYGGTNSDLSATGGTGQVLKQTSVGGNITVAALAASEIGSGAAITKTDDTNVTLTLGGSSSTALLAAASLTLGWTGTLSVARGGTGGGSASGTLLDNITGFSVTGIIVRTGSGTYQARTVTGTTNRVTVTTGDGVSGNPTIDISSSYVGQNTITTLGTIGTGTWQGTTVAVAYGGTGDTGTAWAAWTPTVSSSSGSFDGASSINKNCAFKTLGKTVFWIVEITIVAVGGGTPTGELWVTTPNTPNRAFAAGGAETVNTGMSIRLVVASTETKFRIMKYDNTTIIANGAHIYATGVYEST